ncbi:LysR substrate-binding domain-containing protein [Bradyrhizobium sp. STM 3566]|uniref:LysR substrate-binding domain-containing protein n=1 Tax=Bradyrhizobium sp. STM 3566 TaxID=578928 RepID=UPI00388F7BCF
MRIGEHVQRDMIAVPLTPHLRFAVVGAPSYFAGRERPQSPQDHRHHSCINYRWSNSGALHRWHFDGPQGPFDVDVASSLTLNDTDLMLKACLAGAGLACLPESLVMKYIGNRRLVRVLGEWCQPLSGFFLYYPRQRHMSGALRALIDFLKLRNADSGEKSPGRIREAGQMRRRDRRS